MIRNYNNALAFTSTGAKQDESVAGQHGVYTYKIQGRCHHLLGSLLPTGDDEPKFAQVYFTGGDPLERASIQQRHHFGMLENAMLVQLEAMIRQVNSFYGAFTTFLDRMAVGGTTVSKCQLQLLDPKNRDPRTYNRPTADEVACVYIANDEQPTAGRDIILHLRNSAGLQRMSELHSSFMPLHFTLMFPFGEPGWHPDIPLAGQPLPGRNGVQVGDEEVAQGEDGNNGAQDDPSAALARRTGRGGSKRATQVQFASYYMFKRTVIQFIDEERMDAYS